jgi:hypothetical protein
MTGSTVETTDMVKGVFMWATIAFDENDSHYL